MKKIMVIAFLMLFASSLSAKVLTYKNVNTKEMEEAGFKQRLVLTKKKKFYIFRKDDAFFKINKIGLYFFEEKYKIRLYFLNDNNLFVETKEEKRVIMISRQVFVQFLNEPTALPRIIQGLKDDEFSLDDLSSVLNNMK